MVYEIQPCPESSQLTESCTPETLKLISVSQVPKSEFGQSLLSQAKNGYFKPLG